MDIRRQYFGSHIVNLLHNIADSHFVAFDLEFSGIPERGRDRSSKPTLQENYLELRQAVQQYQILQIGLTLVKLDEANGKYVLHPYNFNISPLPELKERQFRRTWSMNSGAIQFLQRHGFDFGAWITHGVPYLSREEEKMVRAKMNAEAVRQDMIWKSDDEPLIAHIRSSIADWQARPKSEQEEYLNIPNGLVTGLPQELNRYQMRLTHQIVQNEYPGLVTRGMAHFVQITNPNPEQQANHKRIEAEQRERDVLNAIGFRWIMEGIAGSDISNLPNESVVASLPIESQNADEETSVKTLVQELSRKLRKRRKILIGHNCLTDVMYLYKMTIGELPNHINEFTEQLHDLFPAIVDTKFLASSHSDRYGRNMLGDVELDLRSEPFPRINTPSEFDRYLDSAAYHEAGYDSFITAIVAIKLSAKLQKEGSKRKHDQRRQEEQIAEIAASSPPEFGIEDEYETAAESVSDDDKTSHPNLQMGNRTKSAINKLKSLFSSNTETADKPSASSDSAATNSVPTSVVAVKEKTTKKSKPPTTSTSQAATVDKLRSAFASTSIYDKLGSDGDESKMPGDEGPKEATAPADEDEDVTGDEKKQHALARKMDKLVKNGEMMPRWHEEAAFWELYGNKLQVNGTQEGMLKLTD